MNKCQKCGNEVKVGAKFCPKCGAVQEVVVPKPLGSTPNTTSTPTPKSMAPNENGGKTVTIDTGDLKNQAKNYWSYFLEGLQRPTDQLAQKNSWFGYVQFLLISILIAYIPTHFYSLGVNAANNAVSKYSSSDIYGIVQAIGGQVPSASGIFFKVFLFCLIFNLFYVLMGYITVRAVMKNDVSIGQFTTRFGGMLSLQISILVLVDLIVQFSNGISNLVLILVLLAIAASIFSVVFNAVILLHENHSGIDRLYLLLISMLVITIIVYVAIQIGGLNTITGIGSSSLF